MEENEEALSIFSIVKNQFVIGPGGPVAINQMTIHKAMELFEVEKQRACFLKVLKLSEWWISKIGEKGGDHAGGRMEP